jgi:hypothetical protein
MAWARSNLLYYLNPQSAFPSKGGEKRELNQEDGYQIARALLLVGGIVAIVFGATALGANVFSVRAANLLTFMGPLFVTIVGVVALVTSGRVAEEPLAVVLAVLGFMSWASGGILIAIAGIWAIIARHTLK